MVVVVEGNFSVLLWSKTGILSLHSELDQAEQYSVPTDSSIIVFTIMVSLGSWGFSMWPYYCARAWIHIRSATIVFLLLGDTSAFYCWLLNCISILPTQQRDKNEMVEFKVFIIFKHVSPCALCILPDQFLQNSDEHWKIKVGV